MKPLIRSSYQAEVIPEWIDYNGHMNVAYYVLAFDHATDRLLEEIGIGNAYTSRKCASVTHSPLQRV